MSAWKFVVPTDKNYPLPPPDDAYEFKGCAAVAVAETEAEARAVLQSHADITGVDMRWLRIARVSQHPVDRPATLIVVML